MTLWLLSNLLLILSLILIISPRPFHIGLSILATALTTARLYALTCSSWLAFLLFLIYVGGILVIFSYFLAITPNQAQITVPYPWTPVLTLLITMLVTSVLTPSWALKCTLSNKITEFMFLPINFYVLILLTLALLLTIIVVVKTCSLSKGPLRAFI